MEVNIWNIYIPIYVNYIKIPMKFCVNVGVAAAITMYDRMISRGRFPDRPVKPGGPMEMLPVHAHGNYRRKIRSKKEKPVYND